MSFIAEEMPRPIPILDGRPVVKTNRKSAGTKEKCVYCQRRTYRYVGYRPVCSLCEAEHREELDQVWASTRRQSFL